MVKYMEIISKIKYFDKYIAAMVLSKSTQFSVSLVNKRNLTLENN